MKNFFITFCLIISTTSIAKSTKHQVGIGLGSVLFWPEHSSFFGPSLQMQTVVFNNQQYFTFYKKNSNIQLPYIYYTYHLNNKIALRCNGNFQNFTYFKDYTGFSDPPIPNPNQQYYYQFESQKTITFNIGMQYKKTIENISFYGVAEFAPHLYRNIATNYFVSNANPNFSQMEVLKKNRWDLYSFNLLGGVQYQLTKHLSVYYEGGIYNTFISPLSRISLNVGF